MLRFFAYAIRTIFAVALILLAIAVVGKAFAHSRTTADESVLDQPSAAQPCVGFDAWFLDHSCRSDGHVKKTAHHKHHQAHTAAR
jgi:hypothetical protein